MYMANNILDLLKENTIVVRLVKVLFIIICFLIIRTIVNKIFSYRFSSLVKNEKYKYKTKTILSLFESFVNGIIYFLAITFILNVFNINTSSIIAVAGVGGIAIAFASKSLIEDILSGAIILLEDQYNIGDLVNINDITATISSVGLRTTKLVDIDGKEIIIPNGQIKNVVNFSINPMRAYITAYITDYRDFEIVENTLKKACQRAYEKYGLDNVPEIMGIESIDKFGYEVLIQTFVENGTQWNVQRQLRKEVVNALIEDNISFSSLKEGD